MSTQPSLTQFRAVLQKHKENETIYKQKLREINSTRNKIADHLDELQQTYEKKTKANQQKFQSLRIQNESLIRQNILYKTEIESYQSRLLQKQKIIAMLLNQKKDIGGVGSSDRSKSEKTDSINANQQDYKSFKKQITPSFKQQLESSHINDRIKEEIISQDKPTIDIAQDKAGQNQELITHIPKNLTSQPVSIKRKPATVKQQKNQDISQQILVKDNQVTVQPIAPIIYQIQQEKQIKAIPQPPPNKAPKRSAPPPPPKKGEHKQIVATIPIPEIIKQIPSLNNSNTYVEQRIDQIIAKPQQIEPIQQVESHQQEEYFNEQVHGHKQQQEYNYHNQQPYNPYAYQSNLEQQIAQAAQYKGNDKFTAVFHPSPEIQIQDYSHQQSPKTEVDQPDPNNFWSKFANNDHEEPQEVRYTPHQTKPGKSVTKKKKAGISKIAQINFQSQPSINSTDFFSQLARVEPESSNQLQIQESSIDHMDRDNSLISNEHAYFAEEPILTTKPRAVKMHKKKGKRDQIKIVDPSLFE